MWFYDQPYQNLRVSERETGEPSLDLSSKILPFGAEVDHLGKCGEDVVWK